VFLNLFGNDFYATAKRQRDGAGPEFPPTLKVATHDLGDAVEVRGARQWHRHRAGNPGQIVSAFCDDQADRRGTGLGLSIAYDIITQQHGGTIEVDSQLGEFTEFTIRLPRRVAGRHDVNVGPRSCENGKARK
jgi:hypothetical protein